MAGVKLAMPDLGGGEEDPIVQPGDDPRQVPPGHRPVVYQHQHARVPGVDEW